MTSEDFEQLRSLRPALAGFQSIGLLSPAAEAELFPSAAHLPRGVWDLDYPGVRRFDAIVAANVFFYSANPERWLRNVLAACRCFVMQDIVRRRRSRHREQGPDGDRIRFAIGAARPRTAEFFDLNTLGERVLAAHTYFGGANEYDTDPLHFVAIIRGDLAEAKTLE